MTITVKNATKGTYVHEETGLTVCDVFSIADVMECNGAFAHDDAGHWAWVAGRDLRLLVGRMGAGGSLVSLANSLLRKVKIYARGIVYSFPRDSSWGAWNTSGMDVPACERSVSAYSGVRIFGLVTNVAAGAGCSNNQLASAAVTPYPTYWLGATNFGLTQTVAHQELENAAGNGLTFPLPPQIVGRALITIPAKSWEAYLRGWAEEIPNPEQAEVAQRVERAISLFAQKDLPKQLGVVPTVLAPVLITTDGRVLLESNLPPSIHAPGAFVRNTEIRYSPYFAPSLKDVASGWWLTNPIGLADPGSIPAALIPRGGSLIAMNNIGTIGALTAFDPAHTLVSRIDGVDLRNVMGGLAPRSFVATGADVTSAMIIARAFNNNFLDRPPPTQGGSEATSAYQTRLEEMGSKEAYDVDLWLFNHWQMAGQSTVIAGHVLNGLLNDDVRITRASASMLLSGHFDQSMRGDQSAAKQIIPRATSVSLLDWSRIISFVNQ